MANPRKLQHTPGTHPAIPLDNYERIHLASPFVKAAWGVFQKGVELTLDINSGQQHIWKQYHTGWWFQIFFMFIPVWGNDPINYFFF